MKGWKRDKVKEAYRENGGDDHATWRVGKLQDK